MPIVGLDHLLLAAPAGCAQAARDFYGGLLGLEELEKPASLQGRGGVWFSLGNGLQLHVGVDPDFAPATKAHPAFRVADYDALRARFGVEEDDRLPGVRRFYVNDPWGNRLELIEA